MMNESVLTLRGRWPLYLLAAYPIVDYFMQVYPWGIVLKNWDKLILVLLAFYAFRSYLAEGKRTWFATHRLIIFNAILGLAYVLMDVGYLTVSTAGYKVDFWYMLIALTLPYVVQKEDVIPLLKFMVISGMLLALHGIYQYVVKAPIPVMWVSIGEHVRTRVYSIFGSPNIFGSYLAFIVPSAIGLALYETRNSGRFLYGLTAVLATFSLLFTFTRGAWLAFFVGILVLTWLLDKRLTVVTVVVAVLAVFFVPQIHSRIAEFLTPLYWVQMEQSGRIARWMRAVDQMRYNPLFGAGLGRYGGAVASKYFGVIYVDNYYAKTLAETGMVGLLAFLTLVVVYLRDVWRVWKRTVDRRLKYLFAGVFSSLVVLAVHNAVENVFEVPTINMLFWLAGSLVLIYSASEVHSHD